MKGFIVYPDYTVIDNKTHVRLFGKLENNQSFLAILPFKPYFYIQEKDEKRVKKYLDKYTVEKTKMKNKQGESMIKISSDLHIDLNKLNDVIKKTVDTYESDIKPHLRFMIDKDLKGSLEIEGEYQSSERIDRVYHNPQISQADKSYIPKLKIASIDTESS